MTGTSRRLLIIEDEETDYWLLVRHLEREGLDFQAHRVATAAELGEALEEDHWALVLTDYTLPDIDIRAKLQWIMASAPEAPVIMVSGTIGEELAVDLLKSGLDDFVSKDNLSRLVPAIHRALKAAVLRREKSVAETELAVRDRALAAASNGVAITRADDDMPLIYVNPAFERMTGYTSAELLGRNCRLLQGQDHDQDGLDEIRAALHEQRVCQAVVRNYRKDGTLFWNRLGIAPVRNARGEATHFVGTQEDITDERRNQEQLRQAATVFEHAAEGIFITGTDTRILDVNQAFTQITGFTRDEVIGQTPRLWSSGRHGPEFYQGMWHSLEETGQWRGEICNRNRGGDLVTEWMTISVVRDEAGAITHYVAIFSDISGLKRTEEKLEYLAHYDPLTGLPNRLLFHARLEHALQHARRNQLPLAVFFLDLDRFKNINDSLGHPAGDRLLKEVAGRLRRCVREDDTTARTGGDELAVLLENVQDPANAAVVAEKVLLDFSSPFEIEGQELYITPSIGISLYPRDGEDGATLLRNADAALFQAKEQGRNGYAFYAQSLTTHAFEQVLLENALRRALEREELRLYYQPQLDLDSGALIGMEALLRWEHPDMGLITPDRFIPLAEESGMILPIGEWVLETACAQGSAWLDAGITFARIAVNIAGPQIRRGNLLEITERALRESGLPARRLELEVTETFIMEEAQRSIELLAALRALGVTIAIDDFGTGYSSLAYLKRLPIDHLKIDQSFVRDIPADPDDMAISRAVIALGQSLRLEVIAEGIETPEQRDFLLREGCRLGQGYLFSRPIPPDELTARFGPSALEKPA